MTHASLREIQVSDIYHEEANIDKALKTRLSHSEKVRECVRLASEKH